MLKTESESGCTSPWHFFFPCRNEDGNTYDLSSLSRYSDNWEAVTGTGSTEHYLINVCKSLSPQAGSGEWGARRLVARREFGGGERESGRIL